MSNAIGKIEIERLRETHSTGLRAGNSFIVERQVEPLVLDSEISGLPDRHAFLKLGNQFVTLRVCISGHSRHSACVCAASAGGRRPYLRSEITPEEDGRTATCGVAPPMPKMSRSRQDSRWETNHADDFQATLRIAGADVSR